jgi:hypothetical protein
MAIRVEVRSQELGVRSQESGVRSQELGEHRVILYFDFDPRSLTLQRWAFRQ